MVKKVNSSSEYHRRPLVPKSIAYTLVFGSATAIMVSGFIFGWLS